MDMHSRTELTKVVVQRYFGATKKEKSVILKEFCLNTGIGITNFPKSAWLIHLFAHLNIKTPKHIF
jgi:hypothetical protein